MVQINVNAYDVFITSNNLKALEELLQELDNNLNINLQNSVYSTHQQGLDRYAATRQNLFHNDEF